MSALRSKLMIAGAIAALGTGSVATGVAQAKHGSDDPPRHEARDEHGGLRGKAMRHGRDDKAGDDRGGLRAKASRHGRDDAPGDDRGGR